MLRFDEKISSILEHIFHRISWRTRATLFYEVLIYFISQVLLPRPRQYCCQPLKLMCNGLLQSIKNYFCCHLKRGGSAGKHHHYPEASVRSTSFAPSQLFSDRIYELHDNSGSVMTTPTFVAQPYTPNRNEDFLASRTLQPQVVDYQQQWHHHTQRKEPSRKGLSLDLPKNLWPSRVRFDLLN